MAFPCFLPVTDEGAGAAAVPLAGRLSAKTFSHEALSRGGVSTRRFGAVLCQNGVLPTLLCSQVPAEVASRCGSRSPPK